MVFAWPLRGGIYSHHCRMSPHAWWGEGVTALLLQQCLEPFSTIRKHLLDLYWRGFLFEKAHESMREESFTMTCRGS